MVRYVESVDSIEPPQLAGFFVGWDDPPAPETHLEILKGSGHVVLAIDEDTDMVVGFVTAVSDDVLAAYIPLIEVLPEYQGRGIGKELMRRILARLNGLYMVDLVCDADVRPFYDRMGMKQASAMVIRRRSRQSGRR
jgi:ribosomal protein S18 acetylase RimI-like enzyme